MLIFQNIVYQLWHMKMWYEQMVILYKDMVQNLC